MTAETKLIDLIVNRDGISSKVIEMLQEMVTVVFIYLLDVGSCIELVIERLKRYNKGV